MASSLQLAPIVIDIAFTVLTSSNNGVSINKLSFYELLTLLLLHITISNDLY